jgi:hypothetical protein
VRRELRIGDLVRVAAECLAPIFVEENSLSDGLLGVVVDDIDAHEEVQLYHASLHELQFRWWNVESLELISECIALSDEQLENVQGGMSQSQFDNWRSGVINEGG